MKKKGTRRCLHQDTKSLITVYRPKTHICVIYNVRAGHQRRIYASSTLTSALQEIGLPQAIRNNCSVSSGIILAVSVVISSDVTKVGV